MSNSVSSTLVSLRLRGAKLVAPVLGFGALAMIPYALTLNEIHLLSAMLIFGIFAMSLNLLVGFGGMASLGHALFFGAGAYAVGLLSFHRDSGFALSLLVGLAAAALLALVVGFLVRRARGTAYLMITLAASQVFWGLATQWKAVTNGDDGLFGISSPSILGWDFGSTVTYYYVVLVVVAGVFVLLTAISRSPFGYVLRGVRDNEQRMRAVGVDVDRIRHLALVISAVIASLGGVLYAYQERYVGPDVLAATTSGDGLLAVALGGGAVAGPLVGGLVVGLLEDVVGSYTDRYLMILGILFVLVAIFLPRGLAGLAQSLGDTVRPRRRAAEQAIEQRVEPAQAEVTETEGAHHG
ncbi:branched-chain amino acid ABC transporter permease [Nocardioides acrostichi]|uniref:Branched-chain amino acid ABC transporter permease n=1 Tax=Nocardioides acrostichi TaxID=2784339 RepID=A0A930V1M6_9ACTN|nr:branched-chain amino acid ABC transporter permease [Nocardioides acrostichi]MBF4161569.1 branched-chain amino acid ABC transporter permease [Nocardioides acrostichi]